MEDKVIVDGLTFVPYITSEEIRQQVERIAAELRKRPSGEKAALPLRAQRSLHFRRRPL